MAIEETYSWWQSPRFFCSNPASETLKVTVLLDMVFRETTLDAENNPESLVFKDASEVLCGPALGSDSLPDSTDCLWQSWWWFSSLAMISNMFKMMWSILESDNWTVMWTIQLRLLLRSVIHDKWLGKECVSIKKWKAKLKGTFLSAYFIFAIYTVFRQ